MGLDKICVKGDKGHPVNALVKTQLENAHMCFRDRVTSMASCLAVCVMLLGFSGCEDPQARNSTADVQKALNEVKGELASVKADNKKLLDEVGGVQEKLAKQINDRIDQVAEQMTMKTKELLDKVGKDAEQTRQAASSVVGNARSDYDKELAGAKAAFAGDIQKLRDEQKASFEDLKKYMDNQLKELYPYAYQPRRTGDTKAPPQN